MVIMIGDELRTTIGRYQLREQIGSGSFAYVLRAYDPFFKREVAIKILHPRLANDRVANERLIREARAIASIEHPSIVPLYDAGQDNDVVYLVMQLMEGGTLQDKIAQGPLPPEQIHDIITQIGSALDAAHAKGVLHRDIKPSNILFDSQGRAYLADFGIVKLTEATIALTTETLLGTPAYMSPEHSGRNGNVVDASSDRYALGVVAFEMLTGKLPYTAMVPMQMVVRHALAPIPNLSKWNIDKAEQWQGVIDRAIAKEKIERYATCKELAEAIGVISGYHVTNSQPPPILTRPSRLWFLWVIAAFLLGVVAVGQADSFSRLVTFLATPTVETVAVVTQIPTDTPSPTITRSMAVSPTPVEVVSSAIVSDTRQTETPISPTDTPSPTVTATNSPTPTATLTLAPTPTISPTMTATVGSGAAGTGGGLPLDFSDFGFWRRGDEANGTFTQSSQFARSGATSAKLTYDFGTSDNDYVVFLQNNVIEGEPNQISMWVYGDGSGHFLNMWIADSAGQTWQLPMGQVHHTGWQRMVGRLDTNQSWPWTHISGPNNGRIDYPLTFRGIVFDDYSHAYVGSGTIFLDDIEAALLSATATPNPTNTPHPTNTPRPTNTPPTVWPSKTPAPSRTPRPTNTPTRTNTPTLTSTPSPTQTPTPTATPTLVPTETPTVTPVPTSSGPLALFWALWGCRYDGGDWVCNLSLTVEGGVGPYTLQIFDDEPPTEYETASSVSHPIRRTRCIPWVHQVLVTDAIGGTVSEDIFVDPTAWAVFPDGTCTTP